MLNSEVELLVEKSMKMEKLLKNKEFQELFLDDFIKLGAQDISTEFFSANADRKEMLNNRLVAIGIVNNYINGIISSGRNAKDFADEMYKFEQEQ